MSDDQMQSRDETPEDGAEADARPRPVYDQAFFLDLARPRGRRPSALRAAQERWNAWRTDPANADVPVTFEGVDFRTEENRGIKFSGFEFGYEASFAGATFGDRAQFDGATFGYDALFTSATFGERACFDDATFGDGARFDGATFGNWARFGAAVFGNEARFDDAVFGTRVRFEGTVFGSEVSFTGATLDIWARFDGALFGAWAKLDDAKFGAGARFNGASFGDFTRFSNANFDDEVRFLGTTFGIGVQFDGVTFGREASFVGSIGEGDIATQRKGWVNLSEFDLERAEANYRFQRERLGFGPGKFSEIDFHGAHFCGPVYFARRSFERSADFTGARFDLPPDFDGATNLQRIDFTGARAGFAPVDRPWWKPAWTTDSSVAIRLRALRSQIEATKNHDFERDLYIEERKAERGIYFARYRREKRWGALAGHCLWIGVMGAYWVLSDYGRSWLRPASWLAVSIPTFHFLYAGLLSDRREGAVVAAREAVTKASADKDALTVVKSWQAAEARVLVDYDATVGQLAVSNAVPFVGPLTIDGDAKKFLYCGVWPTGKGETVAGSVVEPCRPIPPPGFQIATISQNLLSILLVFFIGLALRNYFRVK